LRQQVRVLCLRAIGGFGLLISPPSWSARQPNHQPLFQLRQGHSQRKRIICFLAVCSQIDRLMELNQLTLDSAMLAQHILLAANTDYSKAHTMFMRRAPSMSWQEAISFPKMALEWYKAARGQ
jgi:hypothetical protein